MTDPTGSTPAAPAGWYADPAGSPQLRWWDGVRWTEHVHAAPAAAQPTAQQAAPPTAQSAAPGLVPMASTAAPYAPAYTAAPAGGLPRVPEGTPVYNPVIWVIVLLPLLSTIALAFFDLRGYMLSAMPTPGERPSPFAGLTSMVDSGYLLIQGLSLAIYAGIVLLAYFDWRTLNRAGFASPFHWAWSFLSGWVYVIGRSVVVRRRSGHGLAPIWVLIAVAVLSFIVGGVKAAGAFSAVISTIR